MPSDDTNWDTDCCQDGFAAPVTEGRYATPGNLLAKCTTPSNFWSR